ncbi:solute carrier family 25, member 32-like protein [Glomus cerebriforme]|uniref:Solute carrier family 25, member 32-like protein n=1 Tax=Glomus cerebriforme TaxID=658196 RepID=A0A397SJZ7_9GLOM|nr:solute carrier family 25, member 32-like protein [Glomus cerebriforme]
MPKSFFGSTALDNAMAGFTAGAVTTLCLHPLDLIKTRFQVDETIQRKHRFGTTFIMMKKIVLKHQFIGLYRGVTPNLAGATASWGFYFYFYDLIKRRMADGDKISKLSPFQHLTASAEAGAITAFFTNPFWVVKTRMCVTDRTDPGAYKGLFDGLYQIAKYEGVKGLYKGMIPALFGTSHGALQFMAYEELKKWRFKINPEKEKNRDKLNNLEYLLTAAASKTFATIITYPYQVVRARLQNQRVAIKYTGVTDTIKKVYKAESILGFYKGLAPNVIRVLPGTCTTFLVYENMSAFFRKHARYE